MEQLNHNYLRKKSDLGFDINVIEYPERILQFGTGVLLKGLPDLIVDNANKKGEFCGRIVMVKSTNRGSIDSLVDQDCLYTVATQGVKEGEIINKKEICTSISRVLIAKNQWGAILYLAKKKELEFVFSNTTEVGIGYYPEKIKYGVCPESFPAKIVAILKYRFEHFCGDLSKGLIFLPTELVSYNGEKLKKVVIQIAEENYHDKAFLSWLKSANTFCNTLVDRIVPGYAKDKLDLRYKDENAIIAEPYALWAIEGGESVRQKLRFCLPGSGAFVVPDIEKYKEIKLRILNASHTFTSGLAFLAGFNFVREAMKDEIFSNFLYELMTGEISFAMSYDISNEEKTDFAKNVLDRFRNPFLDHQWISICMHYSSKMATRCLPLIKNYLSKTNELPTLMTLGFAAHLQFLKPMIKRNGKFYGLLNDNLYLISDPNAEIFYHIWRSKNSLEDKIELILENTQLWGENLNNLNSFAIHICNTMRTIEESGMDKTLLEMTTKEYA